MTRIDPEFKADKQSMIVQPMMLQSVVWNNILQGGVDLNGQWRLSNFQSSTTYNLQSVESRVAALEAGVRDGFYVADLLHFEIVVCFKHRPRLQVDRSEPTESVDLGCK
jgi:hypothetical protein